MKEFYKGLPAKKIEINWNQNPIPMALFLSFLTVPVERSNDHLGSNNGWTMLKNDDLMLVVKGGVVGRTEYLESLEYGIKLANQFNNFVNPFYLFDILTPEGRQFFIDYYKDDIDRTKEAAINRVESAEKYLEEAKQNLQNVLADLETLKASGTSK